MLNLPRLKSTNLFAATTICYMLGFFAPPPCLAQLPPGVVPITSEPDHKVRFENGRVRMIEAVIPRGKTTLFHEHRYEGFYVFFKAEGFTNEPFQGKPRLVNLPNGAVQFIPTPNGPYIHRVSASGDQPAHVSVLELKTQTKGSADSSELRFPPFETAMENSHGRVYRLKLNPGESVDTFTRPANTGIFAISSGRISELPQGKPARPWNLEPGAFRWVEAAEELTIKNDGQAPVELIEIEVF